MPPPILPSPSTRFREGPKASLASQNPCQRRMEGFPEHFSTSRSSGSPPADLGQILQIRTRKRANRLRDGFAALRPALPTPQELPRHPLLFSVAVSGLRVGVAPTEEQSERGW